MLSINDLRKGSVINLAGEPYRVVDYRHSKQARGSAVARLKLRNLRTGTVIGKTLKGNDKVEPADVTQRDVQFLYQQGTQLVVMDLSDYNQYEVSSSVVGPAHRFLVAGSILPAVIFSSQVIDLKVPSHVTLKVTQTAAGARGDTVNAATKPARLEGGAEVQVPLFIKTGDSVKVDTKTGIYLGRA